MAPNEKVTGANAAERRGFAEKYEGTLESLAWRG